MSNRYYSSLTKKYIMALMGLFLFTFLVVHLSINLLLVFDRSLLLHHFSLQDVKKTPAKLFHSMTTV